MENAEKKNEITLEGVIRTAIQLPGIKVNREAFLRERFQSECEERIEIILANGPVNAQCGRNMLRKMAERIINERTLMSTGASFVAGLPGGAAMAATIPADMVQFYGIALRMAQELAYLYGEADLWNGEALDDERVTNQLILYCGVMLGVNGASQAVRVMSSALAKEVLKRMPQEALTKTFYYPIVKSVARWFGVSMTKGLFARGVSKAVPVIGGFVSGGITFATLRPMGQRLADTLDSAHYSYTQADFEADWQDIVEVNEDTEDAGEEAANASPKAEAPAAPAPAPSVLEEIAKAKRMLDAGILSQEEFSAIKAKLISKM